MNKWLREIREKLVKAKDIVNHDAFSQVSSCENCMSMTHTFDGKCGKCGACKKKKKKEI